MKGLYVVPYWLCTDYSSARLALCRCRSQHIIQHSDSSAIKAGSILAIQIFNRQERMLLIYDTLIEVKVLFIAFLELDVLTPLGGVGSENVLV